jgi:hypothetical protein
LKKYRGLLDARGEVSIFPAKNTKEAKYKPRGQATSHWHFRQKNSVLYPLFTEFPPEISTGKQIPFFKSFNCYTKQWKLRTGEWVQEEFSLMTNPSLINR